MSDAQAESETVIRFSDEPDAVYIWSASRIFQRHMARLGVEPVATAQREENRESAWYRVPKSWVHIRKPRRDTMTAEQKAVRADRARRLFSGRKHDSSSSSETLSSKMQALVRGEV